MNSIGPVLISPTSHAALHPIHARVTGGIWEQRRAINQAVSVLRGWDHLHEAGNFANLELAARVRTGTYTNDLPFLDSDVYKWLEAVAWVLGDPDTDPAVVTVLEGHLSDTIALLAAAQEEDGYLDSYFQVHTPGVRFADLNWGHELYCAGHLIQAAIALQRARGDDRLMRIALRFADLIVATFGPGRNEGIGGHPEIETALVELYRQTGQRSYLDTARFFLTQRGHRTLAGRFGFAYWQDHTPILEATSVEGHAVRQLYLLAGVADLFTETGEQPWLDAAARLWDEMCRRRTYLTGGIGSHHADEAFGDPYELPSERSYCETCAAIASVMFSWRMLLATGESKYADLMERTLYNGFLAGMSLDGARFIYANPLQVRDGHLETGSDHDYRRVEWFHCACCPPNAMRLLGSLPHYLAAIAPNELVIHQFAASEIDAGLDAGDVRVELATDFPWQGAVTVTVHATGTDPWTLTLRVPHWATQVDLTVNDETLQIEPTDGWVRIRRAWRPQDTVRYTIGMEPRLTRADPRADALRGCLAVERGPLVYCAESVDNPSISFNDLVVAPNPPVTTAAAPGLDAVVALSLPAGRRETDDLGWWPYGSRAPSQPQDPTTITAVPYFAWGNRGVGTMRVWLPTV